MSAGAPHLQPGQNPGSSWTFGYGYKWWIAEDPQGGFPVAALRAIARAAADD